MKRFSLILVLLASPCFAQSWSNTIAPSRAENWASNAGLPASFTDKGGSNTETTTNPWTPPTRTQSGSTINPSGSASTDLNNINTALSNCTDGHYVLLGSGTFQILGTVVMYKHSCSLRGSGPQSTVIGMAGSGVFWMGAASGGGSCTATNGLSQGSTSIVCNSPSGTAPAVGDIVRLTQCDTGFSGSRCTTGSSADNGGLFVCGYQTTCMTEPATSGSNSSQGQNFLVTSVSGSSTYTIGVSHGLYLPNWSTSQTATLAWNGPASNCVGCGLEDMTLDFTGTASTNFEVQLQNAYSSWIKGVRFLGAGSVTSLLVSGVENSLVSNSAFFPEPTIGSNYQPGVQWGAASDSMFLNNICQGSGPWEGTGQNAGNVIAYNYTRDTFTSYNFNLFWDHHAHAAYELFEGNQAILGADDTWGTHDFDTFFRNYSPCWDTPYVMSAARGIFIDNYQRFENLVGNAIGTSGQCSTYQGNPSSTGIIFRVGTDALTRASLLRWGNVSVITQSTDTPANSGVRFVSGEVPNSTNMPSGTYPNAVTWQNPTPETDNLPCSFFLGAYTSTTCTAHPSGGTGLSWWKICTTWTTFPTSCSATELQPFPPVGPDVAGGPYVNGYAYDVPSAVAWKNLPVDTTYQNSYMITGSSWSGGIEKLTVTSLPNIEHLMGPFQLSGIDPACTSGATINAANEILMTGSSSATVQYALPSNPGVNCTGTFLFPDIRQFDERVYQTDSGGSDSSGPPPAPINVTATVE